jgi:hypothetical protein
MRKLWPALIALVAITLGNVSVVHARPVYKKALAEHFGPFLPKQLNDCRTCHLPGKPGEKEDPEDKPHNAFGSRLKEVKKELTKAGKKTDIISRIEAIAEEDSDGDGVSNLLEILSGHNPGEAADKPTAAELAEAQKKLAAFKARVVYRWTPLETVRRPAVPNVKNASWVRNPIDAFLAAEHQERGLTPRPEAAKHILLRRVYLDLTGLPPTHEELQAFLADSSSDAYEKVVDRLLASPRYGERWGRHWMDVWRYSDWAGYGTEIRESHQHIWHWRDWIVESLNEDRSYDRMIQEMLAGDELAPEDAKTLRATGFLVRHWNLFNRNTWLENVVEHTSKAFLGITMNCARCHDHFFDPITHQEYYSFRAFFEPYHVRTDRVPGQPDLTKVGIPRAFDAFLDAPTYLFERGNDARPDKSKSLPPGVPAVLGGSPLKIEPVKLPLTAHCPDKRVFVIKETLAASAASVPKAQESLGLARRTAAASVNLVAVTNPLEVIALLARMQQANLSVSIAELEVQLAQAKHDALTAAIRAEQLEDIGNKDGPEWTQQAQAAVSFQRKQVVLEARKQVVLARLVPPVEKGKPAAAPKLAEAEKALAKAIVDEKLPLTTAYAKRLVTYPQAPISYGKTLSTPYPQASTGRRLALARWIADRQNPLTARVAMNHIWLRHFGAAIVPTVFDFGQNGQPPTHPALLDWLAAEFMEPSFRREPQASAPPVWSMKHMHRLIVTSSAYRVDSMADSANTAIDRDNRYLWRMNRRRMEAELIRDSVLHVSGQLDLTLGGPEIPFAQGLSSRRRSLYMQHAAEKQVEFLGLFDVANVTECYQRSESVIPQQALALSNSTLVLAQSRLLAGRLTKTVGDQHAVFVKLAFEHVLGRTPHAEEQAECEKFLEEQRILLETKKLTPFAGTAAAPVPPAALPQQRARENLIHVLMNHNDFVTIR